MIIGASRYLCKYILNTTKLYHVHIFSTRYYAVYNATCLGTLEYGAIKN